MLEGELIYRGETAEGSGAEMPGVPAATSLTIVIMLILLYVLGGFFYRWRLSAERARVRTEELQADHDALAAVVLLRNAGPPVPPADIRHLRVVNGGRR